MASKTISLREETYERLAQAKGEGESFSDVIDRLLTDDAHPLYDLIGLLDDEEAESARDRARAFRDGVDRRLTPDDDR